MNQDGFDDVFVGGAKGYSGALYFNTGNLDFIKTNQKALEADAMYEDTAAQFVDVDQDGDLDLVVGSGGNEKADQVNYKNRLYLNNGKGNFTKATDLPSLQTNVSVVAACDFDNDGDQDLFIGSRSVPGIYGITPKQLLLENNGKGQYINVTEKKAFALNDLGMVTDAIWEDIDLDGKKDLIVVGEWMAPTIFKNTGRRLAAYKTNLSTATGFWNTVACADVNNDGKKDLILGNKGTNTTYHCSAKRPMKLFVNDFDNNGTIEQIASQSIDGKDMPIHVKQELAKQIPSIKKKNLNYAEYAKKAVQDIFEAEVMNNAIQRVATTQESMVALSQGGGKFSLQALPAQVQFSTVNSILVQDINQDGNLDLILGGNRYELKPQFSRLDASYGSVLLGSKKGRFTWVSNTDSGVFIRGEVKGIKALHGKGKKNGFIAVVNDGQPKVFVQHD